LARRNIGFLQGEKPVLSEEGIRPAPMIAFRPTKAWTFFPLTQERSQSTPHESVNITERGPMGMLEVSKPAPEDRIELGDDTASSWCVWRQLSWPVGVN
jgi:hypothetical protein